MSFNKEHFENELIWEYSPFQKQINEEKYLAITRILGEKFDSIVDIGCGNGHMLSRFSKTGAKLYGADFSNTALKHLNGFAESIHLDLECVKEHDFDKCDLVMTFDVLEHLRESALKNAINLIKDIACKYIVINVPNDEDLELRRAKCEKCRTIFHPYGHINTFSEAMIVEMFSTNKIQHMATVSLGPTKPYNQHTLSNISKCVFDGYMNIETGTCPSCGGSSLIRRRHPLGLMIKALNRFLGLFVHREKEELIVFFRVLE